MRYRAPKAFPNMRVVTTGLAGLALIVSLCLQARASAQQTTPPAKVTQSSSSTGAVPLVSSHRQVLDRYCVTCHNRRLETAGLRLDEADVANPGERADVWEKVVRKLRTDTMPPSNVPQPSTEDRRALLSWLETSLDKAAVAKPNPGRTDTLRRLNRTEYQNAIRDLLSLDIDATSLLPPDESGHGFDNVTVGDLSPALLDRYISAAQKISRLAIGSTQTSLQSDIIRVPPDVTQEEHVPGLPIGTRGGVSVRYTFAQDGEYDIQIWLARGYNGNVDGLKDPQPHEIQLLLDRTPIGTLTVQKPADGDDSLLDRDFKIRVPVTAGPHDVGVTFLRNSSSLIETARQPLQSHFNERRHPRITPAINQVSITGPYAPHGADNTPSRRRIFVCRPTAPRDEEACAKKILSTLMRRAYRRSISEPDVERPMAFYREGRSDGDFEAGIEKALSAVLDQPRIPVPRGAGSGYRVGRRRLPHQRSRAGIPPVIFSLEQPPRRRAARCGRSRRAPPAGRARPAGQENARRSALVQSREQLRRAVAPAAQPGVGRTERAPVPGLRRQPSSGVSPGDGALRRQRAARRSQRARPAQGGLHLSQRAAGEALRDSQRLRQPLPARHARTRQQAWRIAAARQHPGRDVLCDADLAGDSWRVGPRATSSAPRRRPRSRMCRRSKKVPSPPTSRCGRG